MPRRVLLFVATLLGSLMIVAWILVTDRADIDRRICSRTGLLVSSILHANGGVVEPIDRGCEVKNTGGGRCEVESSFSLMNDPTPVRYTVLITGVTFHEADATLAVAKWDKIKIHGFHDDFVSLLDFCCPKKPKPKRRYPTYRDSDADAEGTCTETQGQMLRYIPPSSGFCYP